MTTTFKDPDTDTKVFGGLIAKRVATRLGKLPEQVHPQHLDDAVEDLRSRARRLPASSVETAKREAARLLMKAREMGSLRAAMDAYKREVRQLHEVEKLTRRQRYSPKQRTTIRAATPAANLVVVLIVGGFVQLPLLAVALLWLPTVYVLLIWRETRVQGESFRAFFEDLRRATEKRRRRTSRSRGSRR